MNKLFVEVSQIDIPDQFFVNFTWDHLDINNFLAFDLQFWPGIMENDEKYLP